MLHITHCFEVFSRQFINKVFYLQFYNTNNNNHYINTNSNANSNNDEQLLIVLLLLLLLLFFSFVKSIQGLIFPFDQIERYKKQNYY